MKALRSKIDGSIYPHIPALLQRGDLEEIPHPCMTIDQDEVVDGVVKSAISKIAAKGKV